MHPKGACKRPRRGHLLIYSLQEFERGQEDDVSSIGRGKLGRLLAWRESAGLVPNLFSGELLHLRRVYLRRAHQQWGCLRVVRLQRGMFQREATHQYQSTV
jgi:hypothetical protein